MKVAFVLALLCVGLVIGVNSGDVSHFKYEHSCVIKNGYCVFEHECPHLIEGEFRNLCPQQKSQGALCCEGYPATEKLSCAEICRPEKQCPTNLNIGRKECPHGEVCCVLV
ncbi:U-scoloptoxin(19)-Sm1a-like [Diabrotica undecimpunctata]|uniref:U-scoloptoxin(19)-Sm1a-like n=1 Tax=Diabrotica undecimpunctata TaxID=50387 RepID=UPI003B639A7B